MLLFLLPDCLMRLVLRASGLWSDYTSISALCWIWFSWPVKQFIYPYSLVDYIIQRLLLFNCSTSLSCLYNAKKMQRRQWIGSSKQINFADIPLTDLTLVFLCLIKGKFEPI